MESCPKCFSYRTLLVPPYKGIWAYHLGQEIMGTFFPRDCSTWKPWSALHEHRLQFSKIYGGWAIPFASVNYPCIALMVKVLGWRGAQKTQGFLQPKHFPSPTTGRTSLQRALHWQWCAASWSTPAVFAPWHRLRGLCAVSSCKMYSTILAMSMHLTIPAGFVYPPSSSSWFTMGFEQINLFWPCWCRLILSCFFGPGWAEASPRSLTLVVAAVPQLSLALLVKGSYWAVCSWQHSGYQKMLSKDPLQGFQWAYQVSSEGFSISACTWLGFKSQRHFKSLLYYC